MTDRTPEVDERGDGGPIVFYDGQCGLCDRSVRGIMSMDRRGRFRFAPLGGATFEALTAPGKPTDTDSVVVYSGGRFMVRGRAVLAILTELGGAFAALAQAARVLPSTWIDALYRWVAKRRRFFGEAEACKLPSRAERDPRLLP